MITQSIALDSVRYDPRTGLLHWRIGHNNQVKEGSRAGSFDKRIKYIRVRINREFYLAHRVIWLMIYGEWPPNEIDHINHVKHDNRLANLRCANRTDNCKNALTRKDNISGITGVNWHKREKKWRAYISNKGKQINLGLFINIEDAKQARKSAESKYNFHPNHGAN